MKLIALMGKSKSGKDTVGQMLIDANPKGAMIAFADKLKEIAMDLYGFSRDDVYTDAGKNRVTDLPCYTCPACHSIDAWLAAPTQVVCRKCTAVGEPGAFKSFWTVRMVLQFLGTEGCRRIDDTVWVKHALARARLYLDGASLGITMPVNEFVVITDCRFRSEAEAIWKAGGEVWRIRRPETDRRAQGISGHASETEMDTIPDSKFQRVVSNDGTLQNLRDKAVEGLTSFLQGSS